MWLNIFGLHFRHSSNKRSFDVAFLAGTVGNKTDDKSAFGKVCDEQRKSASEKIHSITSDSNSYDVETSSESFKPKSAFKKVCQQHHTLGRSLEDDVIRDNKELNFQACIDQKSAINPVMNAANKIIENNDSPIKERNDDLNSLIGPRGDITCLESRVK